MLLDELKKSVHDLTEKVEKSAAKEEIQKMITDVMSKVNRIRNKGEFSLNTESPAGSLQYAFTKSSVDPKVISFQKKADDIYLVSKLLKQSPKTLRIWKDLQDHELVKAMDTETAGEGAEWVPTGLSAEVIDRVRLELKVGNLHTRLPMPTNPYQIPIVSSDPTAYLVAESTADVSNKITASDKGTSDRILTAKKLGARVLFSEELSEDSIVPVLSELKNNIVVALKTGVEDCTINGDTSGTHQDSDVTSAADARKAWLGYRKMAQSAAKVDISTFNADVLRTIRKKMGVYGVNPVNLAWVVGISGYIQMLGIKDDQNNPMVTTIDKYGPNATILTGELAKFDGSPIIVSEKVRETLNASGVYDGTTTTKTEIILVYRPGFRFGDRRKVTIKTDEDIETDQTILVATLRMAFAAMHDYTTEYMVGLGYNLTT